MTKGYKGGMLLRSLAVTSGGFGSEVALKILGSPVVVTFDDVVV